MHKKDIKNGYYTNYYSYYKAFSNLYQWLLHLISSGSGATDAVEQQKLPRENLRIPVGVLELGRLKSGLTQHRFTYCHWLYWIVTRALSHQIRLPILQYFLEDIYFADLFYCTTSLISLYLANQQAREPKVDFRSTHQKLTFVAPMPEQIGTPIMHFPEMSI